MPPPCSPSPAPGTFAGRSRWSPARVHLADRRTRRLRRIAGTSWTTSPNATPHRQWSSNGAFPADYGSPPAFAVALRLGAHDSLRAVEHAVLKGIDPERPRRLRARLRKHAAPKKLIDLGRIYTVERLVERGHQPSGVAAAALGLFDPANYRWTVRRVMGGPPTVVRRTGGAACVGRTIEGTLATANFEPGATARRVPGHVVGPR